MTDITKTRAQFIQMAADELMLIEAGQSLADEDYDKIDDRLDGLLAELAVREVVYVADAGAIQVEYCGPLAQLLANEVSGTFGKPRLADQDRLAIEDRLRIMVQRIAAPNKYLQTDRFLHRRPHLTYSDWSRG